MFNNPITQFIEKLNNSDKLALLRLSLLVLASGFIEVLGIASIAPLIGLLSDSEYISANPYLLNIFNIIGYIPNNMTLFIGFFVIVFFVLSNLLIAYTLWKSVYFSAIQHHKIANRLMEHYLHKKYIDHINSNSSEASKDILHEAGVVSDQIILPILQVFSKSIIIIFISIFLAVINYQVFIISILSLMIIYSIIYFTIKRRMTAYGLQKITANQERYKVINDTFKSIKEIKFNYSENFFLNNFNKPQKDFSILTAKNTLFSVLPRYIIEIVAMSGVFLGIAFLIEFNHLGANKLPQLSLFLIAAYRALPLLQQIYSNLVLLKFNMPVLSNVNKVYKESIIEDTHMEVSLPEEKYKFLELDKISFTYKPNNKILDKISLRLEKGSIYGLIGSSGVGKSTLIDILLGFLKQSEGEIRINNHNIDFTNLKSFRSIVGYVPQEIALLDTNIYENIAFGKEKSDIDYKYIDELIKIVCIDDLISEKTGHYQIGESGLKMSGGQRQRLGIARALYKKPKILILDEGTNSIDHSTELDIFNNIKNYFNDMSLVFITHRKESLKLCDKIYLLENKKINNVDLTDQLTEEVLKKNEKK